MRREKERKIKIIFCSILVNSQIIAFIHISKDTKNSIYILPPNKIKKIYKQKISKTKKQNQQFLIVS